MSISSSSSPLGEVPQSFGVITLIPIRSTTVIVILCSILVIAFEKYLVAVSIWARTHRYNTILTSLLKQLVGLGIGSMLLFVFQCLGRAKNEADNIIYQASLELKFAAIVLLFLLFGFVVQALILFRLDAITTAQFRRIASTRAIELRDGLDHQLNNSGRFQRRLLSFSSGLAEFVGMYPSIVSEAEGKVLEHVFHRKHDVPMAFNFSLYLHTCFKDFMAIASEVSPTSWLFIVGLALINLFKLEVIDPHIHISAGRWCTNDASVDDEEFSCVDYATMAYSCVLLFILEFLMLGTYFIVHRKYNKLLQSGIRTCVEEGADDESPRDSPDSDQNASRNELFQAISSLAETENLESYFELQSVDVSRIVKTGGSARDADPDSVSFGTSNSFDTPRTSGQTPRSGRSSPRILKSATVEDSERLEGVLSEVAMQEMYESYKQRMIRQEHDEAVYKLCASWRDRISVWLGWTDVHQVVKKIESTRKSHKAFLERRSSTHSNIFQYVDSPHDDFQKPFTLFGVRIRRWVELLLVLQVFYLAIWATQLIPIISRASSESILLWVILLTSPLVGNYRLLFLMFRKAVVVESLHSLETSMVWTTFEQSIVAESAADDVRKALRELFLKKNIEPMRWKTTLQRMVANFSAAGYVETDEYDGGEVHALDRSALREFLGSLDIYLNIESFDALWDSIDANMSSSVTWAEIYLMTFPELRRHFRSYEATSKKINAALAETMVSIRDGNPNATKLNFLINCFEFFDASRAKGYVSKDNTKLVITNLGLSLTDLEMNQVFSFVGVSPMDEKVTFRQFLAIFDPTNPEIDRPVRKPALSTIVLENLGLEMMPHSGMVNQIGFADASDPLAAPYVDPNGANGGYIDNELNSGFNYSEFVSTELGGDSVYMGY